MNLLNTQRFFILFALSLSLVLTGCGGGGYAVTGKVTFPDGSPLDTGTVVFESGTQTFYGGISSDGNYAMMGSGTGNRKIPAGTYDVYLMRTVRSGNPTPEAVPMDADGNQIGPPPREVPDIQLVAAKYTRKTTSGLQCVVNGKTEFNITVESP
jgi:hypothetical protein